MIFIEETLIGIMASSIRLLTPILLAGIAELLVEKSGILNLGIEGIMLFGAFSAFMTAYFTENLSLSMIIAIICGIAVALLFAYMTISLALDQVVSGLAINLAAIGITSYLYRATFGWYVSPTPPHLKEVLKEIEIPFLSQIPALGPIFFKHIVPTYIAFLLLPVIWYILYKTGLGLSIRACGEDPLIADYLGINVIKIRYVLLLLEGALGGLAGSLLSIAFYNMFLDNMTLGRGYIAIALIILGRWDPIKLFFATFLFSFVDALQLRVQAAGFVWFPYQLALMMPYLITIITLLVVGRRVKGPASLAKPYKRIK